MAQHPFRPDGGLLDSRTSFLEEAFDLDLTDDQDTIDIAERFFPPLGKANSAHDAGMRLADSILGKASIFGTLGAGLLTMALF